MTTGGPAPEWRAVPFQGETRVAMAWSRWVVRGLGVAFLGAGIWVALAAPEPDRLGWAAVDADAPDEGATGFDALSPAEWAASEAAPTEWTGLWGLVAYTAWDDSERARRRLAAVVRVLAPERHHDRAWAAIWISIARGEASVPGMADPADARVELRLLAEAIRAALGEREYEAIATLYARLDADRVGLLLAAGDLPPFRERAREAVEAPEALAARADAHWSAMERFVLWRDASATEVASLRAMGNFFSGR